MLLFSPIAYAKDIACHTKPCSGTQKADHMRERVGKGVADEIRGRGGEDNIRAGAYTKDRDVLAGGSGDDVLKSADRDDKDVVKGGEGTDICDVDDGDATNSCETVL